MTTTRKSTQLRNSSRSANKLGAPTKIEDLDFGLPDTFGDYSHGGIKAVLPNSIDFEKRIVKKDRGYAGEGIWIIDFMDPTQYCKEYGERVTAKK